MQISLSDKTKTTELLTGQKHSKMFTRNPSWYIYTIKKQGECKSKNMYLVADPECVKE